MIAGSLSAIRLPDISRCGLAEIFVPVIRVHAPR
jgi:hypothetical protein